jgi:tetratricopeptide (TPR) repeat protein
VTDADLDPKLQNLWKKSLVASEQRNWEYVVNLGLPVVQAAPMFFEARMLVRRAEGEMAKGTRKGLFGSGISMSFKSGKKEPLEAMWDLEENVFQKDPFNVKANLEFYDLGMKAGLPDLAVLGLETIRAGHPANTKIAHQLAEHYLTQDMPEKASEVYRLILKQDPRDMSAMKGEKDSAARTSILRQGWSGGDFRSAVKNSDEQNMLELIGKQGMTREQQEQVLAKLSADYEADPTNINTVKFLADILEKMENFDQALGFYHYALTLNPGDVSMSRKIEVLTDKIRDMNMAALEADIESNPNAEDVEQRRADLAELKRQRGYKAIEEAKVRVERNPTDKAYRFDLGQAYFNAGMFGEAIPELQQARTNPNLRIKALLMLGKCFEGKNMNDLAKSAFADGVKDIPMMDNTKKELLYELAMVNLKMGLQEEYLECLKEIYNFDYGYKDVAKRVEESYSK